MGVPVVTLPGQLAVHRCGASLLSNVGLPELVADSQDVYLRIVKDLAGDLPRLGELRTNLRRQMQESPLMDAPRFAADMEAGFRAMWKRWCAADRLG
jgi:predicted O-linked N-acetylglucosamine transferase (SPINDLY family)